MRLPIGTATTGVKLIRDVSQLPAMTQQAQTAGAFADGELQVQAQVAGQLAMIQSVFADGDSSPSTLTSGCEGAGGGASHIRSF